METIKFHKVADLFPRMDEGDFKKLIEDIRENGLLEPIWLDKEGGAIIDGRHRYLACQELGVKPEFRVWNGHGDLVQFVLSINLRRRHLSPSQAAIVARNALPLMKECASERKGGAGKVEEETKRARDAAGETVGVSGKLVDAASALGEHGVDELEELVVKGEASVTAAAEVAKNYDEDEQVEIAKGGKKAVAEAAKKAKAKRKAPTPEPIEIEEETVFAPPRSADEALERIMELLNGLNKEEVDHIVSELKDFASLLETA